MSDGLTKVQEAVEKDCSDAMKELRRTIPVIQHSAKPVFAGQPPVLIEFESITNGRGPGGKAGTQPACGDVSMKRGTRRQHCACQKGVLSNARQGRGGNFELEKSERYIVKVADSVANRSINILRSKIWRN